MVATAPNGYPTPTDSLWGRQMPHAQAGINLVLIGTAAMLASTFASRLVRRRLAAAVTVVLLVGLALLLISVLAWRLHAPVSAGNGA